MKDKKFSAVLCFVLFLLHASSACAELAGRVMRPAIFPGDFAMPGGYRSSSSDDKPDSSETVTITTISLRPAGTGQPYSQTLTASGSPSLWQITGGTLPEGLTLSEDEGSITGIVSAGEIEHNAELPRSFTFEVSASNTAGASDTKTLTIDVYEPISITESALPSAKAGVSYDAHIEASGTCITLWELRPESAVPSWLKLSKTSHHNICSLSGIPTKPGTYTFIASCGNLHFMDEKAFTLTVEPSDGKITITSEVLEPAGAGKPYSQTLTAEGSPSSWSISSGDLPEGLAISEADGTISGIVSKSAISSDAEAEKAYTFTVTAEGSSEPDSKTFSITVYEPVKIKTESLPDGKTGEVYSAIIEASGTRHDFTQMILPPDDLPPGLEASTSEQGKIIITGTPSIEGTYSVRVSFANFWGSAEKLFTLTVEGSPVPSVKPQIIMPGKYEPAIAGNSISLQYTVSGTQPVTWGITGDVPPGLEFDASSGKLSGIAEVTDAGKSSRLPISYNFTVTASNSGGTDSADTRISVWYPPEIVTASNLPEAVINKSYKAEISFDGTEYTAVWRKLAGAVPKGLTITMNNNSRTCTITGTPRESGMFLPMFYVYSRAGMAAKNFTLKVNADTGTETGKPSIDTMSLHEGDTGEPYVELLEASGSRPVTWSKSGTMPKGLRLDKNGTISGIPQKPGVYSFTVNAKNREGSSKKHLSIKINGGAYSKPKITTRALPDASMNKPYSFKLSGTGIAPLIWTFANTRYPAGLYITEDGMIAGIPKEAGKFTVKVKAENSIGQASKSYSLKVSGVAPSIITDNLPAGLRGVEYSSQLLADGTAPVTWSKYGSLPRGLKLNSKTGEITGRPLRQGTYSFRITAKNKYGKDTRMFALIVSDADSYALPEPVNAGTLQDYGTAEGFGHEEFADMFMTSGDEEARGEIYVPEGRPVTFKIGAWPGGYEPGTKDITIYIADEAIALEIADDGTFILPGELVYDEFVIYAVAGGMKTAELYIVAEPEE